MTAALSSASTYAQDPCAEIFYRFGKFLNKTQTSTVKKAKELKSDFSKDGPIRLLLKDAKPSGSSGFGFLQKYSEPKPPSVFFHPVDRAFYAATKNTKGGPRVLDIFAGIDEAVLSPVSRRALSPLYRSRNKKQLSGFVKIPLLLAGGFTIYMLQETAFNAGLNSKIAAQIERDAAVWNDLVDHDVRYRDIQLARDQTIQDGKLPLAEVQKRARQLAFLRHKDLERYYQNYVELDTPGQDPNLRAAELMNMSPFADLRHIAENDIQPGDEYLITSTFSPKATDQQLLRLVDIREQLLKAAAVVDSFKRKPDALDELSLEFLKSLKEDPFIKDLFDREQSGQISKAQLADLLQEDLFWRARLASWQALGLRKRFFDDSGPTNRPLTLQDIRQETLSELSK
jgi:hypothetical protein